MPESSAPPEIVLVAAIARNGVIGAEGGMPWHLPADLKHFKATTLGHPVVMGRRTFESIGRALPGRRNVVVSRSLSSAPDGCVLAASLDEAVRVVEAATVMVIGGGELYREALPRAARMELTLIDAVPAGDTRFPAWSLHDWQLAAMQVRPADQANRYRLVFCTLTRAARAPA